MQRLHELTGRAIDNEYDESGMLLEGSFTCRMGVCADNQRPYRSSCEICEMKKPDSEYDEEADDLICNDCRAKAKLLS